MPNTLEDISLKEKLLADFAVQRSLLELNNPILANFRNNAIESFKSIGFPTKRFEEYRYIQTDSFLHAGLNVPFSNGFDGSKIAYDTFLNDENAIQILLINGFYEGIIHNEHLIPQGLNIMSLAQAIRQNNVHAIASLGTLSDKSSDPFQALNSALFTDGLFIHAQRNVQVNTPIQIIQFAYGNEPLFNQPRILVVADPESRINIVQTITHTPKESAFMVSNTCTEIEVEAGAHVNWTQIQNEADDSSHIHTLTGHVKREASFTTHTISLNGKMIRNNLNIILDESNCEAHLYGYYHPKAEQIIDNHTLVDHRKPFCESNELYKGVIDENGTAIFNGKVYVRKDAQKTNAFQSNKNILLSDKATVNTKPQLEIYADDVKCSHGSSTGLIDPEQLFYLRSRGISIENARALLLNAYAGEVLEHIESEKLREKLAYLIEQRVSKIY